jgi:predicted RNA-binding protein with PUA-like domain
MSSLWLFKQEPSSYSLADLERDGETLWDGVTNPVAQKNLRHTRVGDRVLFYHTGNEKAVVGEMEVVGNPEPDPKAPDSKAVVAKVRFVRRWPEPVTLAAIRGIKAFEGSDLLRIPRLSVVPITAEQWEQLEQLSGLGIKKSKK